MDEFIEKLIEKLEERSAYHLKYGDVNGNTFAGYEGAISIVNQLAEEYKDKNVIADFLQYVRDNANNSAYDNDAGWSLADLIDLSTKFCNVEKHDNSWKSCSRE